MLAGSGARGCVAAPGAGDLLELARAVFADAAGEVEGRLVRRTRILAAFGAQPGIAELLGEPARVRQDTGAAETLAQVLADLSSSAEEELALEDLLAYFGLGGPTLEQALAEGSGLWDGVLVRSVQEDVQRALGGAGKLLVVGGVGAASGQQSVYRVWPKIWEVTSTEGAAPGQGLQGEFERQHGAAYSLSDMHAMDLSSLRWSRPSDAGDLEPRLGHSATIIPRRVTVPRSKHATEMWASAGLNLGFLLRHVSRISEIVPNIESREMGVSMLSVLLKCIAEDARSGIVEDRVPTTFFRSLLEAICGEHGPSAAHLLLRCEASPGWCSLSSIAKVLSYNPIFLSMLPKQLQGAAQLPYGDERSIKIIAEGADFSQEIPFTNVWLAVGFGGDKGDSVTASSEAVSGGDKWKVEKVSMNYNADFNCSLNGQKTVHQHIVQIVTGRANPDLTLKLMGRKVAVSHQGVDTEIASAKINFLDVLRSGDFRKHPTRLFSMRGTEICTVALSVFACGALRRVLQCNHEVHMDFFSLVVLGGRSLRSTHSAMADISVFESQSQKWVTPETSGAWAPVSEHTASRLGNFIVAFGGRDSEGEVVDRLQLMDTESWSWVEDKVCGTRPRARFSHSAAVLEGCGPTSDMSCMVVFGGCSGSEIFNDVNVLEERLGVFTWKRPSLRGSPPFARYGHCSAVVRSDTEFCIYVFGGDTAPRGEDPSLTNTIMSLSWRFADSESLDMEWRTPSTRGPVPPARRDASLAAVGSKLFLCHGWLGSERAPWANDLYILDTTTHTWVNLAFMEHFPSARYGHAMAVADYRETETVHATLDSKHITREAGELYISCKAGERVQVELEARNSSGALTSRAGGAFKAYLTDSEGNLAQEANFEKAENCKHSISLSPVVAGKFNLSVIGVDNKHTKGSPMNMTVSYGDPTHKTCIITGTGDKRCTPGQEADFNISMFDTFGNQMSLDKLESHIEDIAGTASGEMSSVVTFSREGTQLKGVYAVTRSGFYTIDVKYKGAHVVGSPFNIVCDPSRTDIQKCLVEGRAAGNRWFAGSELVLHVRTFDSFDNQRMEGGDKFQAIYSIKHDEGGETEDAISIRDNKNGTYTMAFTPQAAGTCTVKILADDGNGFKPVAGSPVSIQISSGLVDPSKSQASGKGLVGSTIKDTSNAVVSGVESSFCVTLFDKFGKQLNGGNDLVRCGIIDAHKKRIPGNTVDNKDGTYTCSYIPQKACKYSIYAESSCGFTKPVKYEAIKMQDSRVTAVPGQIHAQTCTATGEGVSGFSVARTCTSFTIWARDRFYNKVFDKTALFAVKIMAGWEIPVSVRNNGDGSYTCEYIAGEEPEYFGRTVYTISVKLNGEHILCSPFYQSVAPAGTDPGSCEVTGIPSLLTAGQPSEFKIQARDANGENNFQGNDYFHLDIRVVGNKVSSNTVFGDVKDLKDGTYNVRILAEEHSYYKIVLSVLLDGQVVKGSPYNLTVVPTGLFNVGFWGGYQVVDESVANGFWIGGSGVPASVAGDVGSFSIMSTKDSPLSCEEFMVELRGPDFISGTVDGPTNSVYHASYRGVKAGFYTATVKLGRWPIPGCPFQVEILPTLTNSSSCELDESPLSKCLAGQVTPLKVFTYDEHGNLTNRSDDTFKVHIRGGSLKKVGKKKIFQKFEFSAPVYKSEEGYFVISPEFPSSGHYSIEVYHSRKEEEKYVHIKNSPFQAEALEPPKDVIETPLEQRKILDAKEATVNADAILAERMHSLNQAKRVAFLEKGKNLPKRIKPPAKKDDGPGSLFNLGFWGQTVAENEHSTTEGPTMGKSWHRATLAGRLAAKLPPPK